MDECKEHVTNVVVQDGARVVGRVIPAIRARRLQRLLFPHATVTYMVMASTGSAVLKVWPRILGLYDQSLADGASEGLSEVDQRLQENRPALCIRSLPRTEIAQIYDYEQDRKCGINQHSQVRMSATFKSD